MNHKNGRCTINLHTLKLKYKSLIIDKIYIMKINLID